MKNRIFTKLMIPSVLMISLISSVNAQAAPLKKAETPWEKPTYVYGSGLNEAQIKETASILGVDMDKALSMVVDGEDIKNYINGESSDSGMISSVVVEKGNVNSGVKVNIVDKDKITDINEIQYSNAAITAGVKDVSIKVGSVFQVTGESALTGVYKAMEANGVTLNKERMEVAQAELETVNEISKDLSKDTAFDQKKFDNLIIYIKNELNVFYNNLPADKKITLEDIRGIVEKAIKENGLENVIDQKNIDKLTDLFNKYANTDAIKSSEVIQQLKDISGKVVDQAKDIYNKAQETGIIDKILNVLKSIWDSIMKLIGE